jgi:two-component system sensor histidine kinase AtoS
VQDGKIYNEILLDNLVNGVIAVNAEGIVTVFNREAQRVTGLRFEEAANRPLSGLPAPLAEPIRHILGHGQRMLNREIHLFGHHAEVTVRAGGTVFKSHTGKVLGALLVFSDISDMKKMEAQIRRADRLASIGTLSAGMAHEIKNPLVALKAFTQMLPERYNDEDFRQTFSTLVHHEVERIDTIVNQLLEFSRPAKPNLVRVDLHPVITNSLKLVSEEAFKRHIKVESKLAAVNDAVMADRHQVQQVLLNLLLNAMDSMTAKGCLVVTTTVVEGQYSPTGADLAPRPYLRLDIADTGSGIAQDVLPHIFDPFFTTKSSGTGLGLTVAHGIIMEHGGMIDVESQMGQGTIFHIFFPLLTKAAITAPTTT